MTDELTDHVSEGLLGRIEEEAQNNDEIIDCKRISPRGSKFKGRGHGRCVFEKDDKIIKVAHSRQGIAQNHGAKTVDKYVNYNKDAVAMPLIATDKIVVQEKADTNVGEYFAEDNYAKIEGKLIDKIDKVADEDGIMCGDVQSSPDNHGYIQSKGIVLTDLGLCSTVTPTKTLAESSNKRYEKGKPPREQADWIQNN